ncbi:hypothetical protein O3P69_012997 [Scylla paramamosain]|uniref:Uncharacterized protein n=1 Tax=Scylla paramamosain TaxID=85552 RepID=A0AAW0TU58_SCYPA
MARSGQPSQLRGNEKHNQNTKSGVWQGWVVNVAEFGTAREPKQYCQDSFVAFVREPKQHCQDSFVAFVREPKQYCQDSFVAFVREPKQYCQDSFVAFMREPKQYCQTNAAVGSARRLPRHDHSLVWPGRGAPQGERGTGVASWGGLGVSRGCGWAAAAVARFSCQQCGYQYMGCFVWGWLLVLSSWLPAARPHKAEGDNPYSDPRYTATNETTTLWILSVSETHRKSPDSQRLVVTEALPQNYHRHQSCVQCVIKHKLPGWWGSDTQHSTTQHNPTPPAAAAAATTPEGRWNERLPWRCVTECGSGSGGGRREAEGR